MNLGQNGSEYIGLENTLHKRHPALVVVEVLGLLVVDVFALLGNVLICAAVYRKPLLRTITNMFIVTLAISDIIMAVAAMPLSVGALVTNIWPFGHVACQIQGFLIHVLVFQSVQVITLTAINRNLSVVRPSFYKKVFTKKTTLFMIIAVNILSAAVMAALIFSLTTYFAFHPGKVICVVTFYSLSQSRFFTIIFALVFIAIPFLVISFCYARVMQRIRTHKREFKATRGILDSNSRLAREEDKVSKIVLAIILGFAACWIPCVVIDVVDTTRDGWLPRQVYLLYTFFGFASCAINPILYGCMNKQVRKEIMCILNFCRK